MQQQASEGTTDINSLPNELSQGNVVMNVVEKNGKKIPVSEPQFKKDRCGVCTLPLDQCSPNCAGRAPPIPAQLSKESINQIITGLKEASVNDMTSLPNRDIPIKNDHIMQDENIKPNFVPENTNKYINEENSFEAMLNRSKQQEKEINTINLVYRELQTPLLVMLLFFMFQLPYLRKIMAKNASFLFKKDGNENLYGYVIKTLLFGLAFFTINKGLQHV